MVRTLTLAALGLVAIVANAQVPAEGSRRPGRTETAGRGVAAEVYYRDHYRSGVANRGHRPDWAAACFTLAIRADPRSAAAYEARADLWAAEDWPERALPDYTEAIRLRPGADLYRRRAEARPEKDLDAKIADYTEAIRLDPRMANAYRDRAAALEDKGEDDRAVADRGEVIRLRPGDASAYKARALHWFVKGRNDRAITDLTEAIRLSRGDAELYDLRAMCRPKQDLDARIADYTEAIRIDPTMWSAYVSRGRARLERSEVDAAITDLDAAIRQRVDFAPSYRLRAEAWRAKGDAARAELDTREAARLEEAEQVPATRRDPDPTTEGGEAGRRAARLAAWDKAMADWGMRYTAWGAAMTTWYTRLEAWKRSDMLQSPPQPPDGPPDPPPLPKTDYRIG